MFLELKFQEREKRGKKKGGIIGAFATRVSLVRNNQGKATEDQIVEFLGIDSEQYDEITEMIDANPDMSDWEIVETILANKAKAKL